VRNEAGGIYRFAGTAEDITERIEAEREMRRLEHEISAAAEAERRRIAQDLHDSIGSLLSAINLRLKILGDDVAGGEEGVEESIGRISSMTQQAITQARTLARGLHPVGDDPRGLVVALRDLAAAIDASAPLECRFVCPDTVCIEDYRAANELYRIAQEAANNAVKHSGGSRLSIELRKKDGLILLVVNDDGEGFDPDCGRDGVAGLGLRIMQYRANAVGAALRIEPRRTRGMRVVCELPGKCGGDGASS
jgi:signal transduction histidine kinase